MPELDRRQFLETSLITATSVGLGLGAAACQTGTGQGQAGDGVIVDTNVDLCCWPFRELKYGRTEDLVQKLQHHNIKQAWAGSYDATFHKDIDGVNKRLTQRCEQHDMLVPFGTVNPVWPDWREDLRRCDEMYNMPGIKLYPSYQGYAYDLDQPEVQALFEEAAKRDMIVQLAIDMEDERVHHPRISVEAVDVSPLPEMLKDLDLTMVLVNAFRHVRGDLLQRIVDETDVYFSIERLEGNGGLERIMKGNHWFMGATIPQDRLLFGTHAPFFPVEAATLKLMESPLTEEQVNAVMYANAEGILEAHGLSTG